MHRLEVFRVAFESNCRAIGGLRIRVGCGVRVQIGAFGQRGEEELRGAFGGWGWGGGREEGERDRGLGIVVIIGLALFEEL